MSKNIVVIFSTGADRFEIKNGKLIQTNNFSSRNISLKSLGLQLRKIGTKGKSTGRIYVSPFIGATRGDGYKVEVAASSVTNLSVGCVGFIGSNAKALRQAALKSSKVTA